MTVQDDTISNDVSDDGFDAFLSDLTGEDPKKRASTETETEATEDRTSGTRDLSEDTEADPAEGEETDETTDADPKDHDPDDAEVEIKVGDKVEKAKLRDLKRLFGQEAALTQKSQKLAETVKMVDARALQANSALNAMLGRAQARYQPYAALDMLVLSQRMDTEAFEQLRVDAAAAETDVKFLQQELGNHMKAEQDRAQTAYREAAVECVRNLSDPTTGIKGWNKEVYEDLCDWSAKEGLPELRQTTSSAALRIAHKAMLYDKAQAAAKAAARKVQAAPNTPARVLKPGAAKTTGNTSTRSAMQALRQSGSVDDAADAFLASFAA